MKSALITIGGTREFIDPVRYISNESSGLQGTALIEELIKYKIKTTCICGYVTTKKIVSPYVRYLEAKTAKEMLSLAKKNSNVDIAIFNAAVSDYSVLKKNKIKIKKNNSLKLNLVKNPDILSTIANLKKRPLVVVGFAYETDRHKYYAKKKLIEKNCDYIVLNFPKKKQNIFSNSKTNGYLLDKSFNWYSLENITKRLLAKKVIKHILLNSN